MYRPTADYHNYHSNDASSYAAGTVTSANADGMPTWFFFAHDAEHASNQHG